MTARNLVLATTSAALFVMASLSVEAATASHERVKVTPIKKGKKTVGARINLVIRPGSSSRGMAEKVSVALGRAKKLTNTKGKSGYDIVNDKKVGYMRHQFPWLNLKTGDMKPIKKTYEIKYGDGNDLKPGDKVDVYTLWRVQGGNWHLWGSAQFYGNPDIVELPK